VRWAALALACLTLIGCETTQEKSAKLEHAHRKVAVASRGLTIAQASRSIRVLSTAALHTTEGTAAVITLANSGTSQREVPLLVSVKQSGGSAVTNSEPGLARSLTSVAYLPAHATVVWVDDQLTLVGRASAVTATVGEGKSSTGALPKITLGSHRLEREPSGEVLTGTVNNGSSVTQHELVVYAVATRGGHLIAAGRAVIASVAPGASSQFRIFLIGGSAQGAQLTLSAPPSTFS
jgi:hypothetical protein